jgi:hypothetical protein
MNILWCSDLTLRYPDILQGVRCCDSCHDDADEGYPLVEESIGDQAIEICCATSKALTAAGLLELAGSDRKLDTSGD